MKINGFFLGVSIISLIDYIYLVFKAPYYSFFLSFFTGLIAFIFLGLTFYKREKNEHCQI